MNTKYAFAFPFLPRLWVHLILLFLATGIASATTIAAGSGTLSFTETTTDVGTCTDKFGQLGPIYHYTFTNFSYTLSGTTTPLAGEDIEVIPLPGGGGCPTPTDPSISWTVLPNVITFTPSGTSGKAVVTPAPYQGFINPKYVVVGVTYAPPGSPSSVTYTDSTLVGNTTTTTGSFQNDVNVTVSLTDDISAWTAIGGAAVKVTGTESTDVTQGTNSSSTVTTSKTYTLS